MQEVSQSVWLLALSIDIDDQTEGFKGQHQDKRDITYKAEIE